MLQFMKSKANYVNFAVDEFEVFAALRLATYVVLSLSMPNGLQCILYVVKLLQLYRYSHYFSGPVFINFTLQLSLP